MKLFKTLALGIALAGSAFAAQQSLAYEVEASAAVSSMYLFRGVDAANGKPQVSGDVTVSESGAYASVWVTNAAVGDEVKNTEGGDTLTVSKDGIEYDVTVGYGGEYKGLSYDLNVISYVYPNSADGELENIGDFSEVVATVGYGPIEVSYADNVAGYTGFNYTTVSGVAGKFSALMGFANTEGDNDYSHIDLTYQHNDNFSMTLSQIVDQDLNESTDDEAIDEDLNVLVTYSMPINL